MEGRVRVGSILFHCFEFDRMYEFWRMALGYVPREAPKDGWVILRDPKGRGPNISLDRFPRRREGKRSRIHLDLYTSDQAGEVERLLGLGATRYPWRYPEHADYIVLADPDDNLFCVVQAEDEAAPG
jgi:hypothetical protein